MIPLSRQALRHLSGGSRFAIVRNCRSPLTSFQTRHATQEVKAGAEPNSGGNTENQTTPTTDPQGLKIKELEKQLEESKHELLLCMADRENTRKIAKRDVDNAKAFGTQSFATSLLDVADNLTRAIESVPKDLLTSNAPLKSLYDGLDLTSKELQRVFGAHEIVKLHPVGEKFNPNTHQALMEVADPSKESGTIAFVMKSGYSLKGRLLRPASVGVVKAPKPAEPKAPESTTPEENKAQA